MIPQPPPGQGPIDPRGAFSPPPPAPGGPPGPPPPNWSQTPPPMAPIPPIPMMPPPYFMPPRPRGGGFVRGIFITLATSILGLSLALNAYLLIAVGLTGRSAGAEQNVIIDGDPTQKVAVVSVTGVITSETSKRFERIMREVEDDSNIKALVVEIDTPGGEVTASDEIYQRLLKYKTERHVKIVASMGGMATSGGYYVACAADHIYAQPTTLTGNIGVVMQRFNVSELMDKYGVKETSITPAGSKFKNSESPFKPESPETAVYLRGIAEDIFARFKTIVADSRGNRLKDTIEHVADGRAFTANDARKMGLVDDIDYAQAAYAKAAALAGLTKQQVVRYQRAPGFLELLGGAGMDSRLPDINVRVDPGLINELTTPRLMYLYRGG